MPQKRSKITKDKASSVWLYFQRALKKDYLIFGDDIALAQKAGIAFAKITSSKKQMPELQQWVDKYIEQNVWQRCLTSIRQNKYRRQSPYHPVNIRLHGDTYMRLRFYAGESGLNLSEAVDQLLQTVKKRKSQQ